MSLNVFDLFDHHLRIDEMYICIFMLGKTSQFCIFHRKKMLKIDFPIGWSEKYEKPQFFQNYSQSTEL